MKEFEIDLPSIENRSIAARIHLLHFYSVREDFLNAWTKHEAFLLEHEQKVKRALQRQASIGDCCIEMKTNG